MPFTFSRLDIPDVFLIVPNIFHDDRGFFMESYKETDFVEAGIRERFVQDNHSKSGRNVVRGLHFQRRPKAQGKLVRVTVGRVWDVAVDIRPNSTTYLRWVARELTDQGGEMLYIPPGFAHGFAALTDGVHLQYKCTAEYDPVLDAGIRWDDPDIGVEWPVSAPVLSQKDVELPTVREAFTS